MTPRFIRACAVALCILALPAGALAQRALHWDNVEVAAHLDAHGRLLVTETQTMVFNGDWNGGERRFNIRPRQKLRLLGLDRADDDRLIPMVRDSSLDDVDDYAFTDDTTLRWRSRLPADAPFESASRTYVLRYQLSNILIKNGDDYTLDHDFLFPDRQGVITRASVALTLDPAWQPRTEVRSVYTAEQVPPGRGLVVTIPLGHTGGGVGQRDQERGGGGVDCAAGCRGQAEERDVKEEVDDAVSRGRPEDARRLRACARRWPVLPEARRDFD